MKPGFGRTGLLGGHDNHRLLLFLAKTIPAGLSWALALSACVYAQTVPPDKESLENSEGAGMASYADLNGYPGPKHILEMQEELNLTEQQLKDVQSIFEAMKENARAKGDAIIATEVALERSFRVGNVTEADAKRLSREIGILRGELRAVHLTAHIQAKHVLTKKQAATYNSIRGRMRQHKHGP